MIIQSIYPIIESRLFWFYFILLICIAVLKRMRHVRILINGIWFSTDGSVPKHAVDNFVQLAQDIKKSVYKRHYQLFFWTDTKKLSPDVKKRFKQHGIKIKDYRDVSPPDSISKTANEWVAQLLALGNGNNKLFYVLASDIFRLYLLLKELPSNFKRFSFSCYIDCNDISLNQIPNPFTFRKIDSIAFHFVEFSFDDHPFFSKLVNSHDEFRPLLTNDVIIAANKKNTPLFNELFESYCNNLININTSANGMIELLKMSRDAMEILDDEMVCIIIFTTTHMTNSLYAEIAQATKINLLHFSEQHLSKKEIKGIQDASDFIDFERDFEKGFTCLQRDDIKTMESVMREDAEMYREFWCQLFIQRYAMTNQK